MNDSQFDNNDFWFASNDPDKQGPSFGFDWQEELPPTFEGSTTSFPTQTTGSARVNQASMIADKGAPLSSDVLAAASMLYQNGTIAHDFMSTFTNQVYTENGLEDAQRVAPAFKRARLGFNSNPELSNNFTPSEEQCKNPNKGVHTSKMQFDPEAQQLLGNRSVGKQDSLRWGSDSGFLNYRYEAPPDQPSEEARTKDLLHNLDCLETQSSAANTRPSTPVRKPTTEWNQTQFGGFKSPSILKSSKTNGTSTKETSRPKKRHKSKSHSKDHDMEDESPLSNDGRIESNTGEMLPRKHRADSSVAKNPRENLSEEQKRTNHILSEQKRRNLIKQGFDDLCSLVPDLHGGGYSKSTMLLQAGEWLGDLLYGNELLKAQLSELNGQNI